VRRGASSDDSQRLGVRQRTREAGTAVVEFALIVPLLLLIVFGILDFGRALNYLNDSTQLARAGARWAVVDKPFADLDKWDDTTCATSLQQCIKDNGVTGEMRDATTVCIDFMGNTDPQVGDPIKVTVTVDFTWLPYLGGEKAPFPLDAASTTMTGSAVMRLEQPPQEFADGCTS
jgi:Flp pilus assembly protein TadG